MAITLGSAYGKIELDASGVNSGAAAAAAAMAGVSRAGREMGASFDVVARDAKAFQSSFTGLGLGLVAASAAITAGMGKAIQSQFAFHDSLIKTASLAGESESKLDGMGEQVLAMSKKFVTGENTAKDLADGLFFVESAGFKGADAMSVLETSAMAAAAGLGSTKIVADAVTSTLNAYQLGAGQASHVTDILTNAVTQGKASADSFAPAFGRVLPIAAAAGVSFEQVAASMATMTRIGLSTDEAATALRGVLSALEKPGKQAADALASLGYSTEDLRKSIRDKGLLDTLADLMDKTGGNMDMLGLIIPNVRALTGVLATAGSQAGAYSKILDSMNTAQGATAKAFEITSKDAGYQTEVLRNKVAALGITMGKDLEPAVLSMAKSASGLVDSFSAMSPAMRGVAEGGMALTAALTAAAGGFILLAPRIIEGYGAMVQFAAFGKDVVSGLQLMKAGFSATEVATTGFAGATAAAVVPLAAIVASLIAAYKAYEFYQENQKRATEAGDAFAAHLRDMEKAGKSTEEIMTEYAATQGRVNAAYAAAPGYLRPFIDQQKILAGGANEYVRILGQGNMAQADYEAEVRKVAAAQGMLVDETGNLVRAIQTYDAESNQWVETGRQVVQANYMMTEGQRRVNEELKNASSYVDGHVLAQTKSSSAIEKATEDMKAEADAALKLRDAQAQVADAVLSAAQSFTQSNEKLKDRTDLEQQLEKLDKEIAKNGPARTAVVTKSTMTTNELTAAQSKLYAAEEGLWNIKRKKGETDAQLNARMDQERVAVDNLKGKIAEATGTIGAHTAVVGGATAAQDKERETILGKMSAIDQEIQKELARQAVESLTPEMFGTGAEAAARYAEAKRGLMLSTGMVTAESLAEKDAINLLTGALAAGQISPERYAVALGNVKNAAADGKVSLSELMGTMTGIGSDERIALGMTNVARNIVDPLARAKTDAVAAGQDLMTGMTQGVQAGAAGMGTAITNSVDLGLDSLRTAYQMKSPSLVMAGVGTDLMAGMALGVAGGATELGAAMADSLNMAMAPFVTGALMMTGAMAALNASVAMTRDTINLGLNAAMVGTAVLASGAVADIGEPITAGMTLAYNAFSGAAQMANALADVMREIKSMSGITSHITLVTHQLTIIEKTIDKNQGETGGGEGNPTPSGNRPQAYALGGVVNRTGMALVHAGEPIFTPGMVKGMEAIPSELMGAARGIAAQVTAQQVAGTRDESRYYDQIRNDYGSTNGGRNGDRAIQVNVNIGRVDSEMDVRQMAFQIAAEIKRQQR